MASTSLMVLSLDFTVVVVILRRCPPYFLLTVTKHKLIEQHWALALTCYSGGLLLAWLYRNLLKGTWEFPDGSRVKDPVSSLLWLWSSLCPGFYFWPMGRTKGCLKDSKSFVFSIFIIFLFCVELTFAREGKDRKERPLHWVIWTIKRDKKY